jgi:Phage tail protein
VTIPVIPPVYQVGSWAAGGAGGQTDSFGVTWMVNPQGTSGIFDSAAPRLNHTPFNEQDGAQRSRNYLSPLPITIQGTAQGASAAGVAASRRQFAGLFAGGVQRPLVITDIDGTTLTVVVEMNGQQKITPQSVGLDFDWQLVVIAADPRKYLPTVSSTTGLPNTSGGLDWATGGGLDWATGGGLNWGVVGSTGLISLVNVGTAEAWPTFTISAPTDGSVLSNPMIVNQTTGQTLRYVDTLVLGDVVIINTSPYNKSVTKNGAPYRRNLQIAQYFSVPANSTVVVQFQGTSVSSTALLTATLSPAVYV